MAKKIIPDPCRVEIRPPKKYKKEKRHFPNVKNDIIIPRVVSMWKNPTSEIIPLEDRLEATRSRETRVVQKVTKIISLNKALDKIEEMCREEKKKKNIYLDFDS